MYFIEDNETNYFWCCKSSQFKVDTFLVCFLTCVFVITCSFPVDPPKVQIITLKTGKSHLNYNGMLGPHFKICILFYVEILQEKSPNITRIKSWHKNSKQSYHCIKMSNVEHLIKLLFGIIFTYSRSLKRKFKCCVALILHCTKPFISLKTTII